MNKNLKKLKDFLLGHTNYFKVIVIMETWLKDENYLYQIPNYIPVRLTRKESRK